jgi:hypothetical protein
VADGPGWADLRLVEAARSAAARARRSAAATTESVLRARATAFPAGLAADRGWHPVLRTDPTWSLTGSLHPASPAEWAAAVGVFCGPAQYAGGGFVTGPDGRDYPVVAPFLRVGGERYYDDGAHHDALADLEGADPGWRTAGEQRGIAALGSMSVFDSLGTLGRAVTPQIADYAVIDPGRLPAVVAGHVSPALPVPRSPETSLGNEPPLPRAGERVGSAIDAVQLAAAGVGAVQAFLGRDARAYQVLFEEHPDGRLRARIRTFQTLAAPGLSVVATRALWVDGQGRLVERDVRRAPGRPAPSQLRAPGVTPASYLEPVRSWPAG